MRRYINVCNCDMFNVYGNVYLDHLKFCVVCIDGQRYVYCSECNVVCNECNEPLKFFVFYSVYVDLQYDEISLTLTALCCVCTHVVILSLSVRLSWHPMWMW